MTFKVILKVTLKVCIVLRLITGFKAPMDSAVTAAKMDFGNFDICSLRGENNFMGEHPQFGCVPVLEAACVAAGPR